MRSSPDPAAVRPKHWLLRHRGIDVYRIYRHGNPRDGFMTSWFRTADAPNDECHPTDFDVRALPEDLCRRHHVPANRSGMADLAPAAAAIREAIDLGIVTAAGGPEMPESRQCR